MKSEKNSLSLRTYQITEIKDLLLRKETEGGVSHGVG